MALQHIEAVSYPIRDGDCYSWDAVTLWGGNRMKQLTTVYVNGHFLTMDRSVPVVEAILVQEGRIAALGPRQPVESQAPSNVRRIDLGGRTVVPGLNDCHCHIL